MLLVAHNPVASALGVNHCHMATCNPVASALVGQALLARVIDRLHMHDYMHNKQLWHRKQLIMVVGLRSNVVMVVALRVRAVPSAACAPTLRDSMIPHIDCTQLASQQVVYCTIANPTRWLMVE